jgi:hypothetical protein
MNLASVMGFRTVLAFCIILRTLVSLVRTDVVSSTSSKANAGRFGVVMAWGASLSRKSKCITIRTITVVILFMALAGALD